MLTNSCSPSEMKDGWIYLNYCPIFRWNTDDQFWTKRRILGRRSDTWILENLRNFECELLWRPLQKKRTKKTVKFDGICRSHHEVSKEYSVLDGWISTHVVWIRIPPPPPRAGRSNFENKKRMSTWREGVRQVTNTVRRNVGAQNVTSGGVYKHS